MRRYLMVLLFTFGLVACATPTATPTILAPTIQSTNAPTIIAQPPNSPTAIAQPGNTPTVLRVTPSATNAPVPAEFQSLYSALDASLTSFDKSFTASGNAPVAFAVELLPANGNRGTALLDPQALASTRNFLDGMQKMGAQGVTVGIKYPLLMPDFANSAQYTEFYKNVAREIHQRKMKMDVEIGVVFPPPISNLDVSYRGLTLDQFKARYHEMAQIILNQVQPDYLNLDAEPDTEAAITGLRALNTPQGFTDLVNATLKDLNRGNTLVGAGSGSWSGLDFVKSEAANTTLDFISIHVYPVVGQTLPNIAAMADIAHQSNKRVIIDEMWLYKADTFTPSMSNSSADMIRLNTYSFWAPLDQKFLTELMRVARAKNIEYLSAYWPSTFFAYLDYTPQLKTTAYNDVLSLWNAQVGPNMNVGKYTATGAVVQQLIQATR